MKRDKERITAFSFISKKLRIHEAVNTSCMSKVRTLPIYNPYIIRKINLVTSMRYLRFLLNRESLLNCITCS